MYWCSYVHRNMIQCCIRLYLKNYGIKDIEMAVIIMTLLTNTSHSINSQTKAIVASTCVRTTVVDTDMLTTITRNAFIVVWKASNSIEEEW